MKSLKDFEVVKLSESAPVTGGDSGMGMNECGTSSTHYNLGSGTFYGSWDDEGCC